MFSYKNFNLFIITLPQIKTKSHFWVVVGGQRKSVHRPHRRGGKKSAFFPQFVSFNCDSNLTNLILIYFSAFNYIPDGDFCPVISAPWSSRCFIVPFDPVPVSSKPQLSQEDGRRLAVTEFPVGTLMNIVFCCDPNGPVVFF